MLIAPLLTGVAVGTSATAAPATGKWRLEVPAPPTPRRDPAMVYDPAAHHIVLFGGDGGGGNYLNDTWVWNGHAWTEMKVPGPPIRTRAAMVYDAARRQVLLFGGQTKTGALDDTWTWDGKRWRAADTSAKPPARYGAGMVYDAASRKVLLFGGTDTSDTWIWDGSSIETPRWTQAAVDPQHAADPAPAARDDPGLVYDAARGRVLLFGGTGTNGGATLDATTWAWTPATGTWRAAATTGPSARRGAGLVYDPASRQVVLVGGRDGTAASGETWTWNGARWTKEKSGPGARYNPGLVADAACRCVLLLGGQVGAGSPVSDSWRWNGSSWAAVAPHPVSRWYAMGMAYDPGNRQVVAFGGFGEANGVQLVGETWVWQGGGWTQGTSNGPPRTHPWTTVYDAARGQVVVFRQYSGSYGATWVWSGRRWSYVSAVAPPDATVSTAPVYAYHAAARQIVAFYGPAPYFGAGKPGRTMIWNGRQWLLASGPQPMARDNAAMVYDAASRQVVLFGGSGCPRTGVLGSGQGPDLYNGNGYCSDTWTWNGSRWSRVSGLMPPARALPVMVYDGAHSKVVLFSGIGEYTVEGTGIAADAGGFGDATLQVGLADTWLWDGQRWSEARPKHVPTARRLASGVYDAAAKVVVMFGGVGDLGVAGSGTRAPQGDTTENLGDTWLWNGSDWVDATPKTGPGPRFGHYLVYDDANRRAFLAGGSCTVPSTVAGLGAGPSFGETDAPCADNWTSAARRWTKQPGVSPDSVPPPVYDAAIRRVVMLNDRGLWTWGT
ncbi:MAG: large repetitive protein [Frankiaceae bacterium]|jgi:hypothetical protein|nr:large repetitive protein [Frankiaceae bacterium]